MNNVVLRFVHGPDNGTVQTLTAVEGGVPEPRWVFPERNGRGGGADVNHVYLRAGQPNADGSWTYTYDRAVPSTRTDRP
jgi:hypothetical protein